VLFINVFLSNKTQGLRYDRGLLGPSPDRVDVFKYSLSSLAPLSWSHIVIHYELGGGSSTTMVMPGCRVPTRGRS
jgi:hypothetical protein